MKKELELYVHLPFCVKKCQYCDFLSGPYGDGIQGAYLQALKEEIAAAGPSVKEYPVTSLFFGGGTPSLLNGGEMEALTAAIFQHFSVTEECEISMEGNPGTFTQENLKAYRRAGINRLSIGCQSVRDEELQILGRIHTFQDFLESYHMAQEAGFANINVDLMSALPGQSAEAWEENLRTVAELHPEHISAYSLMVEEGTPFYDMDLDLPGEEAERLMYECTTSILGAYGYRQYEISNYALPGRECRHNMGYWRRKNYLGLGLGAASLLEEERFSNTRVMEEYLENSARLDRIRMEHQRLSAKEQMEEFMFLGLRMMEGISRTKFAGTFGLDIGRVYGAVLDKYMNLGLLGEEKDRIFLTRQGIGVSNRIFADFLLE